MLAPSHDPVRTLVPEFARRLAAGEFGTSGTAYRALDSAEELSTDGSNASQVRLHPAVLVPHAGACLAVREDANP
jgi:hypothetical protein